MRNMRRVALLVALIVAFITGSPAVADTGDRTSAMSSTNTEMSTNQCAGMAVVTQLTGAPGSTPGQIDVWISTTKSTCVGRVRVKYLKRVGGPAYYTEYRYAVGKTVTGISVPSGLRCYTEIGLRRNSGSYYTRFQMAGTRYNGCGV